jgi:hypothetical protein
MEVSLEIGSCLEDIPEAVIVKNNVSYVTYERILVFPLRSCVSWLFVLLFCW